MKIIRLRFDTILFILLEIIAIFLTIEADKNKSVFMFNTLSTITNGLYTFSYNVKNYLSLKQENQSLLENNKQLLKELLNCKGYNRQKFDVTYAHILKNTVSRKNNLILLSAGSADGVMEQSAVVSEKLNVIGVIIKVSQHYSAALSILNQLTKLSVKHKPTNAFGTLVWNGNNPRFMTLEDIPVYVRVKVGDTIVTSGYSNIFPEGLTVGTIYKITKSKHSNTYKIKVKLAEDLVRVTNVFIIHNKSKNELDSLLIQAKSVIGE